MAKRQRSVDEVVISRIMLIFFIHGVATRDVKYADSLKAMIRAQSLEKKAAIPHFYASFWGNTLSDVSKMWHQIHQGLQEHKAENPQVDLQDIFRYQLFREGLLSAFVGDMFTYLNPIRGYEIRKLIAQQLIGFIKEFPQETDLHFIAHSLGTVILWDILFSDLFAAKDPAYHIRAIIQGFNRESQSRQVKLRSITTMGSPILFFNTMLGIDPAKVNAFAQNQTQPLKWLNVLHASDVIAYPLASFKGKSDCFQIQDAYIATDVNIPGKMARAAGQMELSMALEASNAHTDYWSCESTVRLITRHLFNHADIQWNNSASMLQASRDLLQNTAGLTEDQLRLHLKDVPTEQYVFLDGSGRLLHIVNLAKIHHVYLLDHQETCQLAGYVGWVHSSGLQKQIDLIRDKFC